MFFIPLICLALPSFLPSLSLPPSITHSLPFPPFIPLLFVIKLATCRPTKALQYCLPLSLPWGRRDSRGPDEGPEWWLRDACALYLLQEKYEDFLGFTDYACLSCHQRWRHRGRVAWPFSLICFTVSSCKSNPICVLFYTSSFFFGACVAVRS